MTCKGPNRVIIDTVTKRCSCMVEWLVFSHALQVVMALLVYLLLNSSRILLSRGLVMVFWRLLSPDLFQCIGTCTQDGHVLMPFSKSTGMGPSTEGIVTIDTKYQGSTKCNVLPLTPHLRCDPIRIPPQSRLSTVGMEQQTYENDGFYDQEAASYLSYESYPAQRNHRPSGRFIPITQKGWIPQTIKNSNRRLSSAGEIYTRLRNAMSMMSLF